MAWPRNRFPCIVFRVSSSRVGPPSSSSGPTPITPNSSYVARTASKIRSSERRENGRPSTIEAPKRRLATAVSSMRPPDVGAARCLTKREGSARDPIREPVRTAGARSPRESFPGIPFSRLLRVEWGKATGTRAARWLLVLGAASTIGLLLAWLTAPSSRDQTYTGYLGVVAFGVTILLPVVAILTLTGEWSQRTVLTTFTQEPRRIRVINAKIAVSLLLSAGGAVFGALVTAGGLGLAAALG